MTWTIASPAADRDRRAGLRRMRTVAVALLVLAALVYALTIRASGGWAYLHAASEASMVGAIADWFAVTALFRRPLGLPIPHTALIPNRKALLASSLQDFVADNFLSEAVVRERMAAASVSSRLGEWLTDPSNARRVVDEAALLIGAGLGRMRPDDVAELLRSELLPRLADEPLSAPAGVLLAEVVEAGAHHNLVDVVVTELHGWLADNVTAVGRALASRAPWWTPQWLDDKVIARVHEEAVAWLKEIRDDPRHSARHSVDDLLGRLAHDLQYEPDTMARTEDLKRRLLGQPQVTDSVVAVWEAIRRVMLSALADPSSQLRTRLGMAVAELGERLRTDLTVAGRVDEYAADAAAFVVARYGRDLTGVISATIERWDGREAARRIELHVGRDLQFVRINGTIVGGLAGLLIYGVSQLF